MKHPIRRRFRSPRLQADEGTERLEAFSDGVFAFAITLLVVELHVPLAPAGAKHFDLAAAMVAQWPIFFAWVLSIVNLGIYWANHHYLMRLYARTDHFARLLHVGFLMTLTFLPYPTEVLGTYIRLPDQQRIAVQVYALGLLASAIGWSVTWWYACWAGLVDEKLDPKFVKELSVRHYLSVLPFVAAILVSYVSWVLGLLCILAIVLVYLAPPPLPRYLPES